MTLPAASIAQPAPAPAAAVLVVWRAGPGRDGFEQRLQALTVCEVQCAGEPMAAFTSARATPPAALFVHAGLRPIGALTFVRELRAARVLRPETPLLIVNDPAAAFSLEEARVAGAQGVVFAAGEDAAILASLPEAARAAARPAAMGQAAWPALRADLRRAHEEVAAWGADGAFARLDAAQEALDRAAMTAFSLGDADLMKRLNTLAPVVDAGRRTWDADHRTMLQALAAATEFAKARIDKAHVPSP